jgi:WD40 repeat protein
LDGADLSGCSFRGCSLRYAKLDNADLRSADLTGADIRGIRVEQTARVDAIAADLESEAVFAVYSDGVIRKWEMRAGGRWVPTIVFEGLEARAREIAMVTPQFAAALLERELIVFATAVDRPWTVLSRAPISPFLLALGATSGGVAALHHADRSELCIVPVGAAELQILQIDGVAGPLNYLQTTGDQLQVPESSGSEGDRSVFARVRGWWLLTNYWIGGRPVDATLWDLRSLTSRTVFASRIQGASAVDVEETQDGGLLFVGTGDGHLWVGAWDGDEGDVPLTVFGDGPQHDGPVSALKVLGRGKVVSGGHDRSIRIVDIRRTTAPEVLFLTLRCRGIVLDSVTGDEERSTLAALAEADVS